MSSDSGLIAWAITCVTALIVMAIAPAIVYLIDRPTKSERESERNEHQL